MKNILDAHSRLYGSAAFGAIHFDGGGQGKAIDAAIDALSHAQTVCLERPIHPSEIHEACEYLSGMNGRAAYHVRKFKDGLKIADQSQRFEATQAALRMIAKQFGQ